MSRTRIASLLLAVALVRADGAAASGGPDPSTHPQSFLRNTWTTAQGLPQSTVSAIRQTRDGYLWIGTFGGLVRFDGVTFTVFTVANTTALKGNRILRLHEDRGGTLWICTEQGGAARVRDSRFLAPVTTREGLPSDRIYGAADGQDGDVWLATDRGVVRVHDGRGVQTLTTRDGLPHDETNAIVEDGAGGVWIGTMAGVAHASGGRVSTVDRGDVDRPQVRSLHRAADGTIWVGTFTGLARVQNNALRRVAVPDAASGAATPPQDGVPDDLVYDVTSDADGTVWAASRKGLICVRAGASVRYEARDGLADTSLRSIGIDREHDVWLGFNVAGLSRWRKGMVTMLTQRDGVGERSVLPILADRRGGVWVGAMCGGLTHFVAGDRHVVADARGLLPGVCAHALDEDPDGTIWAGTASGLFRIVDGHAVPAGDAYGLKSTDRVYAIHHDRSGVLWIGSYGGLTRADGVRVSRFQTRDGLVNDDVRFLTEDREGGLWIGTAGGASRLANGRFTNYTTANGLSQAYVRAIHEDSDGVIWFGTYGGGIDRLKDGRISAVTTRQGLFDDVVSQIVEDGDGNFWMSGNRGVFRASRRELNDAADGRIAALTSIGYGVGDGMVTSETNGGGQPAGARTADGRLWFPTIEGVAILDPRGRSNHVAPPVVIEQVSIDGTAVAPPVDTLDVPAGTRRVEIRYTGLSLAAPERVRFRYALEGYDRGWVDAGARRVAYYTSLPSGRYRFHVIASNDEGVWNTTGASIDVRQRPRFYQTLAFQALVALGVVALGAAGYRLRLRQLVRRTRELEHHVVTRTAEVVARSEELTRANDRLAEANAAITAARDDMLSTLNQLRLGVALVDRRGEVAFVNEQGRHLFEIDPESPRRRWDELLPLEPRDRAQLQAIAEMPPARRTRLPVRAETPSGRTYWMEVDVHDDPRDPERRIFCLYDLSEVYDLRRLLDGKAQFHGLVGQSAAMQLVVKQIRDLARVDATVLVEGETGTGKELVAKALHDASPRRGRAFVPVNCAGLTESLLASTLFGHRRGAFTGAVGDQVGLFESGDGGTVFLDEIGDVPMPIQNSLLRVLQEKEIMRVGENRPHKIDVRIVAATHRDLAAEVAAGRFREDLLYRIRVARVRLPPLRERAEDIPLLAAWFLGQVRSATNRERLEISQDAMDLLREHAWPGNVRELKSAIDSAAIRAVAGVIQPGDLPPELFTTSAVAAVGAAPTRSRQEVVDALARAQGNRAAAARLLGIGRSTLYRRLRELGIEREIE